MGNPNLIPGGNDISSFRKGLNKLAWKLNPSASPTFAGLTVNGLIATTTLTVSGAVTLSGAVTMSSSLTLSFLTASRLMATNASSGVTSVANLASWIAGTANQITVTDDTDGTVTLSTPQDIHTTANPTFQGMLLDQNTDAIGLNIDSEATTLENYGLQVVTGQGACTAYLSYGVADNGSCWLGLPPTGSYSASFFFTRNLTSTATDCPIMMIHQTHAEDDQACLHLLQDGTGPALIVEGDLSLIGDIEVSGNIVIPDNGYIGSVSTPQAIQIEDDGEINLTGRLNLTGAGGDLTLTGHIIMTDLAHIGVVDNSPMITFNNEDDSVDVTGALTVTSLITCDDILVSNPVNVYLLSHDSFADFVANEHIDWTNATNNLVTTGSITGNSLITAANIGIAADLDLIQLSSDKVKIAAADLEFTGDILWPEATATSGVFRPTTSPTSTMLFYKGDSVFFGTNAGNFAYLTGTNNAAVGGQALTSLTSGYENAAVGTLAMRYNQEGYRLAVVGYAALQNVLAGTADVAIGTTAGQGKKYANSSTYIGHEAGYGQATHGGSITAFADAGGGQITVTSAGHGLSTGQQVIIFGTTNYDGVYTIANALLNTYEITAAWVSDDATGYGLATAEGIQNVMVGALAGRTTCYGSENTLIGFAAGYSLNASCSSNVFIGYRAGQSLTVSNTLVIGNSDTSQLIYGEFDNMFVKLNAYAEIQTTSSLAQPALLLDQDDVDEAFINFEGTSEAGTTKNITTYTAGNSIQGFVKMEVNGAAVWMPYYDAPTS